MSYLSALDELDQSVVGKKVRIINKDESSLNWRA